MEKLIADCSLGEVLKVPLTESEAEVRVIEEQQAVTLEAAVQAARTNEATLQTKLQEALTQAATYRTHLKSTSPVLTAAQRLERLEAIAGFVLGVVTWLIRLRLRRLDSTD